MTSSIETMRAPHVTGFLYELLIPQGVEYANPDPVSWDAGSCVITLRKGPPGELSELPGLAEKHLAIVQMKDHHPTLESAQRVIEPLLDAWTVFAGLEATRPRMSFRYLAGQVIDKDPPIGGAESVARGAGVHHTTDAVIVDRVEEYAAPAAGFVSSPDVQTMWQRYTACLSGREPISGMAYFCLTVFENSAGGRSRAAKRYKLDEELLRKLGYLCSQVGDASTARKLKASSEQRPHTAMETEWMLAAVRAIVRRAGEWAFDPAASFARITLSDLPPLAIGSSPNPSPT
jgi:hypothetical protein